MAAEKQSGVRDEVRPGVGKVVTFDEWIAKVKKLNTAISFDPGTPMWLHVIRDWNAMAIAFPDRFEQKFFVWDPDGVRFEVVTDWANANIVKKETEVTVPSIAQPVGPPAPGDLVQPVTPEPVVTVPAGAGGFGS